MTDRRPRRHLALVLLTLVALLALAVPPVTGFAAGQKTRPVGALPGRYIVTYKSGVTAHAKTDAFAGNDLLKSVAVRHVYNSVMSGFAADLTDEQLAALRADPDVATISPDYAVAAYADTLPTGIRRTGANFNALSQMGSGLNPVDIDVAIIDTGIDIDHPDLNVAGGVNCVPNETSFDDRNGHGTHVAGTVGALDNGSGVVGVAPGARLWAVRVLNAAGEGEFSDVMCGIDWITANAGTIEVANMSLGGPAPEGDCNDGSLHQAVCESIAAGVTYIVAAGNSGEDAANDVPANYDEVMTVSAIVDTDGKPGHLGGDTFFYGADDTLAYFSNYGADVDIAAPGFGIYSTWMNGGYNTIAGTSMAAPHVAGAAALYLMAHPEATPAEVMAGLLAVAWPQNSANGFSGDPDPYHEPLLNVGDIGGPPLPASCTATPDAVAPGGTLTFSCRYFSPSEFARVYFDSPTSSMRGIVIIGANGSGTGNLLMQDVPFGPHTIYLVGGTSGRQATVTTTILPVFTIGTTTGKVGATATVQVRGFAAQESVDLRWTPAAGAPYTMRSFTTLAGGNGYGFFTVPEAAAGTYTVQAVGATSGASLSANYTVVPSTTLSLPSAKPGQTTTVTLRGYTPGESVEVRWYDGGGYTVVGTVTASALGSASTSFVIPQAVNGQHTVEGAGSNGSLSSTPLTVQPSLVAAPLFGSAGMTMNITLTGFKANENITLRWYDTSTSWSPLATVTTGPNGSTTLTVTVPEGINGIHQVQALSASNLSTAAYFFTQPGMSLSPTSGTAGTSLTVSFTGYRAGEVVTARWYTNSYTFVAVGSATASATGSGTITFSVPAATVGLHKVEVLGGSSYARASANFSYTAN